jgi:hypothetical protein
MKKLFFCLLVLLCGCRDTEHSEGLVVQFPTVSAPAAITSGPQEHLFASYYGINSWSADQKYATVLQTTVRHHLPDEHEPAILGLVAMDSKQFLPLTETRAWNFQQGCMAHWLATSPDSLIIYNDLVDGRFVSIIMNVHSKKKIKTIPFPVSAVSPNGREAVSINFARLRITRTDYGYGGEGQNARPDVTFPEDDGLFLVDLDAGTATMLVSIADVRSEVPELQGEQIEYFNHTLFSRDGAKIFWLARSQPNPRNTTAFVVSRDGKRLLRCFPDGWEGSHFDWLNGSELMITARYDAKLWNHILFTVGQNDYRRLGNGILDYDGHGTFSPDGRWMVTDTYPNNALHEQKLYLMDMATQAVLSLGRFVEPPEFMGGWRCDLHPRWSPGGDRIGFNSTFTGSRQVYVMELAW